MGNKTAGIGRWRIAVMGTLLQLCLGTVYAWSYFQKPIMERFGWSNSQTAWTFSIAIGALGLAAAWSGMNLAKYGPRGALEKLWARKVQRDRARADGVRLTRVWRLPARAQSRRCSVPGKFGARFSPRDSCLCGSCFSSTSRRASCSSAFSHP
ncbi:hypothetical protein SPIROBIBN47_180030 [uncultured spirochete]|jgi:hypothetical protein|uniref:Major facilitator superfamily (MFS) profile domain-containing protein n=1 Tax=uncultured spirochete TaxID=156406 RepID=A0A3P3XGI9_9SPIR|nr:hypothetical protein SPIROBIBN47_180030 [uncultured spirochete]